MTDTAITFKNRENTILNAIIGKYAHTSMYANKCIKNIVWALVSQRWDAVIHVCHVFPETYNISNDDICNMLDELYVYVQYYTRE